MRELRNLVVDTSIWIDLERGSLLELAFRLPAAIHVPDLLYYNEMTGLRRGKLKKMGICLRQLDSKAIKYARKYRLECKQLSIPDCYALYLAYKNQWTLCTRDRDLRIVAHNNGVDCHGLLWILDWMFEDHIAEPLTLHSSLKAIAEHRRCRLPKREVNRRLEAWKNAADRQAV